MSASWGPGTVIHGRYRLDSLLGRGGMGSVWRAEHLQLRSPVAIKLLDSAISKSEQMSKRFLREAQSAALLRSPHVVQVLDFGVEEGTAFIVMELLQGESLAERIKRVKRLPAEDVIRFLTQVLRAVSKAHEAGIIHRDLKPDNIFICADDLEIAKVLDFGVAKVTGGDLVGAGGTQPGTMIGTPYYMSPEQVKATGVDPRSDLWSIAVIAYECLVGARPFIGEELGELVLAICTGSAPVPSQNVQVPPGFDEWFAKGTQRDRELRFGSAREMADALIELSTAVGPARPQFSTVRNLGAISIPMPPKPNASPAKVSGPHFDLTTGQRAVAALDHSRAAVSPAIYALIGAVALIVACLGWFVGSGRAVTLKPSVAGEPAAASLTTSKPAVAPTSPASSAAFVLERPAAPVVPSGAAAAEASAPSATALAVRPNAKAVPSASARVDSKAGTPRKNDPLENQEWRR
ncbi:MAG TPA: serine/threonine-protein kinase [Polyangiaceae bacterium]|nr:serine/threonine-protein kinase [Polyangiaceae bacterium]